MKCNVIKDLIPLYIDNCCSEESAKIVKEHLDNCQSCKELYESMRTPSDFAPVAAVPKKLRKINDWKASILQSVLLFVSFAIITVGVSLEAATDSGLMNGYWAFSVVIPATGFMLSLANWYFVRLYKSRKAFSNCSLFVTLGICICAFIWASFHYGFSFSIFSYHELFESFSFDVFLDLLEGLAMIFGKGFAFTAILCVLSKLLSDKYAVMLGKE